MRVQTGTAQGPGPPAPGQQSLKESSSTWPKEQEDWKASEGSKNLFKMIFATCPNIHQNKLNSRPQLLTL